MMTSQRVLIIGLDPDKLDMTAPGLPPGVSSQTLKAGISKVKAAFEAKGDHLETCGLDPAARSNQSLKLNSHKSPMIA